MERSYLLKINKKVAERPQHMLMRVAVGIHGEDIDAVIETYNLMSEVCFGIPKQFIFDFSFMQAFFSALVHTCLPNTLQCCIKKSSTFIVFLANDEGGFDRRDL